MSKRGGFKDPSNGNGYIWRDAKAVHAFLYKRAHNVTRAACQIPFWCDATDPEGDKLKGVLYDRMQRGKYTRSRTLVGRAATDAYIIEFCRLNNLTYNLQDFGI